MNAKGLKSTDAQLLLRDSYETLYGIYNHAGAEGLDPLALVMMNPSENTVLRGPLRVRMKEYIDKGIQKYFGMSFDKFIDQPTYVIELMLIEANERIEKEAPAVNHLMNELSNLGKQ